MTFEELRSLLRSEAQARRDGIQAVVTVGAASMRVEVETVPGRTQGVWIAHETTAEDEVVRLVSPAARIPKGRELAPDAARALLRRNAQLSAGAIALVSLDGDEHIALVVPLSLASLDPAGAVLALLRAANAADAFEETLGSDAL